MAETVEDGPIIAMLAVNSDVPIPKDVTMIRLTALVHDSTAVLIPAADRPDTMKAALALYYRSIPKPFNALISVYYKGGKVVNTPLNGIQLQEGKRLTYSADFFNAGFKIQLNDVWIDTIVVRF